MSRALLNQSGRVLAIAPPTRSRRAIGVFLLVFLASGCSRDPEHAAKQFVANGDRHASAGRVKEAAIEYRNAIRQTPAAVEPHAKLAGVAARTSDIQTVVRELVQIAELAPADSVAQVQAGSVYLLAGRFGEARDRAEAALRLKGDDASAHLLLGQALAGLHDAERGEASLREAVRLAPDAVEPRVALASQEWTAGRAQAAEAELRRALQANAAHPLANRAMALLYTVSDRTPLAEPHWKAVAASPSGDPFALADYYLSQRRFADAERELRSVASTSQLRDAAQARLVAAFYAHGEKRQARDEVNALLARNPASVPVLLLKARLDVADGKPDEALASIATALAADPASPDAAFLEGQVHALSGNTQKAIDAFEKVAADHRASAAPAVALASIHLQSNDRAKALEWAERANKAQPGRLDARSALVAALAANGLLDRALEEATASADAWPRSAAVQTQLGQVRAAKADVAGARHAFTAALALDPASTQALSALAQLDLAANRPHDAQARIDRRLREHPDSLPLLLLSARTDIGAGASAKAEATLKRAAELDPSNLETFELLGQMYIREGRLDAAREQFEAVARRQPNAVGAKTMAAMLLEAQGRRADAVRTYEAIVAAHPAAGVAANNLAWRYAEDGRLDEALQLALVARHELGRTPNGRDTLGWIYILKKQPLDAIPLFAQCTEADPENPTYAYHLAVAYTEAGYAVKAREVLAAALASSRPFAARDQAAQLMARVSADSKAGRR
jgi:predicted Zn-dependent protease